MVSSYYSASTPNQPVYFGLSTDDKPTVGVPNASVFYEMNTKNLYLFDAQNGTWIKQ